MDWTRRELKENAKALLKNIYWKAVLVALVLAFVTGGANAGSSSRASSELSESDKEIILQGIDKLLGTDLYDEYQNDYDYQYNTYNMSYMNTSNVSAEDLALIGVIVGVVGLVLLVGILVGSLLNYLVFKPIEVGCMKFFANADRGEESLNDMGSCFESGVWGNTCKVMFLKSLYTGLWTLLFIIPGIIKAYEYMMVPYILADHPDWTSSEIFEKSREMMTGNKWKAFVLELSFLGWRILAILTFGLLNLFYVSPYYDLTEAQLYSTLKYEYDRENYEYVTE